MSSLAPPEARGPLRRERLRTARLYFVCEAMPGGRDPDSLLNAALGGGADILQLREKQLGRDEIVRSAWTYRRLCDTYSALFIVNDDPWLAQSVGADGVHLGQDDMAVEEAREILGPDMIIGLSTHSEEQLAASGGVPAQAGRGRRERGVLRTRATEDAEMRRAGTSSAVDYVSAGPIWETPTKPGRPGTGLAYIEHAATHSPHPFFATGGIDPSNAPEVVAAGARRLVAVRAIRDAADPAAAAGALRGALAAVGEAAPGA